MIGCVIALVFQGTREYYANASYNKFSLMVPVYSGARPMNYGAGIDPSLDRALIIVEYTVSDPLEIVGAFYADKSFPNGWVQDGVCDQEECWLTHTDGRSAGLSFSEPLRFLNEGQHKLQYTYFDEPKKDPGPKSTTP